MQRSKCGTLRDRFYRRLIKTDACWLWNGHVDLCGYGRIGHENRNALAHRVSYELHFGKIPIGMHVCHRCDVRNCVNPNHLFLGTNDDNIADKIAKGRQWHPIGELHHRAKLDWQKVGEIRRRYPSISGPALASEYGVSAVVIYGIIHGKLWKTKGEINACQ